MTLEIGRYSPAHVTGFPDVSSPPKSSSRWSKVGEWFKYRIGKGKLGPALYDGFATYRSTSADLAAAPPTTTARRPCDPPAKRLAPSSRRALDSPGTAWNAPDAG